jgi:hypothetical protein
VLLAVSHIITTTRAQNIGKVVLITPQFQLGIGSHKHLHPEYSRAGPANAELHLSY